MFYKILGLSFRFFIMNTSMNAKTKHKNTRILFLTTQHIVRPYVRK